MFLNGLSLHIVSFYRLAPFTHHDEGGPEVGMAVVRDSELLFIEFKVICGKLLTRCAVLIGCKEFCKKTLLFFVREYAVI